MQNVIINIRNNNTFRKRNPHDVTVQHSVVLGGHIVVFLPTFLILSSTTPASFSQRHCRTGRKEYKTETATPPGEARLSSSSAQGRAAVWRYVYESCHICSSSKSSGSSSSSGKTAGSDVSFYCTAADNDVGKGGYDGTGCKANMEAEIAQIDKSSGKRFKSLVARLFLAPVAKHCLAVPPQVRFEAAAGATSKGFGVHVCVRCLFFPQVQRRS